MGSVSVSVSVLAQVRGYCTGMGTGPVVPPHGAVRGIARYCVPHSNHPTTLSNTESSKEPWSSMG